MTTRKLLRVERTINIYNNSNNELIEEVNVDKIPFEELKNIVPPKGDDPLLYDGYDLDETQLNKLNSYLTQEIKFDFKKRSYILVCGGIYE